MYIEALAFIHMEARNVVRIFSELNWGFFLNDVLNPQNNFEEDVTVTPFNLHFMIRFILPLIKFQHAHRMVAQISNFHEFSNQSVLSNQKNSEFMKPCGEKLNRKYIMLHAFYRLLWEAQTCSCLN